MAEIANLTEPYTLGEIEAIPPLPIGELLEAVIIDAVEDGLSPPYLLSNRFPTPPIAAAFLTGVNSLEENPVVIEGFGPPYIINGALIPENDFLEPTQGQIWPRIG